LWQLESELCSDDLIEDTLQHAAAHCNTLTATHLQHTCNTLQQDLSRQLESELCVDDLIEGEAFEATLSREEMEQVDTPVAVRCSVL